MPRREDEAIAVEPVGVGRVVTKRMPVEDRADLGAAEGQAEVTALTRDHGVDGEAAGGSGGLGEDLSRGGGSSSLAPSPGGE